MSALPVGATCLVCSRGELPAAVETGPGEYCCLACWNVVDPPKTYSTVDVTGLEPDAVRVVERIVARLRKGHAQYGPMVIDRDPRDLTHEANEEFLDAAVYLAMRTLKEKL